MRKALARPRVSSDAVSVLSSRNTTVLTAMPRSRSESPRLVTLENTLNSSSGTTSAAMTCDQITPKTPTYCVWPWAISPSAMPSAVAMMTRKPNPAVRGAFEVPQRGEGDDGGREGGPVDELRWHESSLHEVDGRIGMMNR